MVGIAAGDGAPPGPARLHGRRRAAGIYGSIITAALLAAGGGELPTDALVLMVMVELLVYWLAEEYAQILGEQAAAGVVPTLDNVREALTATWPMITASFAPLAALVAARLAGASALTAANIGLAVAILLLTFHGWIAARAAQLKGWKLAGATSVALFLGLVLIGLKDLILIHLH